MSNNVNSTLFELAAEMLDYWTGTIHEKLIKQALEDNDLEALNEHVSKARHAMFEIEYRPRDVYTESEAPDVY